MYLFFSYRIVTTGSESSALNGVAIRETRQNGKILTSVASIKVLMVYGSSLYLH